MTVISGHCGIRMPLSTLASAGIFDHTACVGRLTYVISCLLFPLISGSLFAGSDSVKMLLSQPSGGPSQVYRDPQGYFELILPAGWQVADEYSDDPRGKVLFNGPDDLKWRIISETGNTSTFDDLRRNAQSAKEQFPGLRIREEKLNQWDSLIIQGIIQGKYIKILTFIASGETHSFCFFGSPAFLNQNWGVLETTMKTYIPLPRNSSKKERIQASLAHWIRLTNLFYEIGDIENAKVSLQAAKELDTQDERLVALSEKILGSQVHEHNPSVVQDANTVDAEIGNIANPQANPEFPFDVFPKEDFLNGISMYILAFFLLWTPLIGVVAAIGIGLLGKHAIQYTSNFAPLALFWLLVTAAGCFAVIGAPFSAIWKVWLLYAENGLVLPYALNLLGGVTLGALGYTGFRFYMSRVKRPHQIKAGTKQVVSFAKNYTLWRDVPKINSAILNILSMDNCPWKGKINPESIAVAQADNCHLFFSDSELLLSIRQDHQVFFEVLPAKRVTLDDLQYTMSVSDNTVILPAATSE
jgi:hypothetical protein